MLTDASGRIIDYLRISVTDRCDFRCVYCHPPAGVSHRRASTLLDTDGFVRIARVGVDLGVRRIRLTGGEPLLYADILPLVGRLAALPGLEDLALTTNGSHLGALALPLRRAGLRRVNLSIDSLQPERFARISRGGDLAETLRALDEARRAGLDVKINTVALEGWNADELDDFVRFSVERGVEVRFIEFMPLCGQGWNPGLFLGAPEIRRRLSGRHLLRPLEPEGVATRFTTPTGARLGFIPTMSEPFCNGCRSIRLTSWGGLRPCLFSNREVDLRPLIEADGGGRDADAALRDAFARAALAKPERNPVLFAGEDAASLRIRSIGG